MYNYMYNCESISYPLFTSISINTCTNISIFSQQILVKVFLIFSLLLSSLYFYLNKYLYLQHHSNHFLSTNTCESIFYLLFLFLSPLSISIFSFHFYLLISIFSFHLYLLYFISILMNYIFKYTLNYSIKIINNGSK